MINYFITTERRDIARWFVCSISFILILFNLYSLHSNYNRLYEIERIENPTDYIHPNQDTLNNLEIRDSVLSSLPDPAEVISQSVQEIKPSEKLNLERKNTFNILEICAEMCFLVLIYAGRINVEGTKNKYG